jgi:NAD(P)-dependent dehydrogenase (short-subunit alcohol dehydrogenase family)
MGRLDGRVAIVTGAAHGERAAIGAVYAKALAREGAKVVAADVKDCGSVVDEIAALQGTAIAMKLDVRDEGSVQAMVAKTLERFGRLDILVNNAAIGSNIPPVPVTEMGIGQWDELMAVNVRGPFLCVKAAVPAMRKNNYGKIVNVGSTTMVTGLPDRLHYVTAKGAILAMTRALATELGPSGIRINTISYGLVTNPVTEAEFAAHPAKRNAIIGERAMAKDLYAADLIGTLVYLCSADSDAVTGQCLVVDNGAVYN